MSFDRLKAKHSRLIPDGFPFECSSGWVGILEDFFATANAVLPKKTRMMLWKEVYGKRHRPPGTVWVLKQIKEKFGTLRIYYDVGGIGEAAQAALRDAYRLAEARSHHTCEQCGRRGWLRDDHGWYSVSCDVHAVSQDTGTMLPRDEALRWMSVRVFRDGRADEWLTYDPAIDRIVPCPPPEGEGL